MNMEKEIERAIGRIMGSEDPRKVLRELVNKAANPAERVVHSCSGCGEKDMLCFRCKATEVVGERTMAAAPIAFNMFKQWAADRRSRRNDGQ